MAKLRRNRAKKRRGTRPQDKYLEWLEENQPIRFCAYCLSAYDRLEIEHYEPEAFLLARSRNPHVPSNLYLACHDCNHSKLDYHPRNRSRKRLPDASNSFHVLNAFRYDYGALLEIDEGSFQAANGLPVRPLANVKGSIILLGLDQRIDLSDRRAGLLKTHRILERLVAESSRAAVEYSPDVRRAARQVWRNRLLFVALNIPLSPELQSFAQREWERWERSTS